MLRFKTTISCERLLVMNVGLHSKKMIPFFTITLFLFSMLYTCQTDVHSLVCFIKTGVM